MGLFVLSEQSSVGGCRKKDTFYQTNELSERTHCGSTVFSIIFIPNLTHGPADFRPLVLFSVQNVMSSHLLPRLNFQLPSYSFWQSPPWAWLECRVTLFQAKGRGQLFALRDDEQGWGAPGAKDSYRPIYPQPTQPPLPKQYVAKQATNTTIPVMNCCLQIDL